MRWSIRYQLLVPLLLLLAGIAGISTWTAVASAQRARNQIENQFHNVVRTLNEANLPVAPNWLAEMHGLSGAEYLLIDHEGRQTRTTGLMSVSIDLPPAGDMTGEGNALRLSSRIQVGDISYLCGGVRLRRPQGATLFIFYPEKQWQDARWEAVRPSLILGGFMGLASLFVAAGIGRTFGRRIQELHRRTHVIACGDFSPMPLPSRNDEFRDLAQSINDMARQLADLQETMQKTERLRLLGQVSGGLAHQLRNGVTGARLALQVHSREANGQTNSEGIEVALRQLRLVEANLQRFLHLGKTDSQAPQPCSLTAIIDETIALLRPQSRHARIELSWEKPAQPFPILGDAGQLSQLFLNVINNGMEAAGPGGQVHVRIQESPDEKIRVEIIDSGPGPSPAIADRLFEAFATDKRDGVGLGLALARQVTEDHAGRIGWTRRGDQTVFYVELPLKKAPKQPTIIETEKSRSS
jgi:signal transduction histidine kinase